MAIPSSAIKRPPEDGDESLDLDRGRPKRQAFEPPNPPSNETSSPSGASAAGTVAKPQPWAKRTEDLAAIIDQMQASHEQQLAELRHQQAALSSTLDQLKSQLSEHFTSQISAMYLLQNVRAC